jgi:hypothetical protein
VKQKKPSSNCCAHQHDCDEKETHPAATHDGDASGDLEVVLVLSVAARKCQGLATLWLTAGAVTLAPAMTIAIEHVPAGEVASLDRELCSISLLPGVPPPRA